MNALTRVSRIAAAAALFCTAGVAVAMPISGTYGSNGTVTVDFHVASAARVDFASTGGISDPTFSLFDGAGLHLITNDDSNGLLPHITRDLDAGNYSLLISYCCQVFAYVSANGSQSSSSDGFNSGSYAIGGSGTLLGMQQYMDTYGSRTYAGWSYSLNMSNATLGASRLAVPEPQSWALVGVAMAGLGLSRRQGRAG